MHEQAGHEDTSRAVERCGASIMMYTDQPLLGYGVQSLLQELGAGLTLALGPVESLAEAVRSVRPDILLVDWAPEVSVSLISQIRNANPATRIMVMAFALSWELSRQLKSLGVAGFLQRNCSAEECVQAFLRMANATSRLADADDFPAQPGEMVRLSRREGQLVTLLSQGLKNKEIAQCLGISEGTVRVYLSKLYLKTRANDRFELALLGLRNNANLFAGWPQTTAQEDPDSYGLQDVPPVKTLWLKHSRERLLAAVAGDERR